MLRKLTYFYKTRLHVKTFHVMYKNAFKRRILSTSTEITRLVMSLEIRADNKFFTTQKLINSLVKKYEICIYEYIYAHEIWHENSWRRRQTWGALLCTQVFIVHRASRVRRNISRIKIDNSALLAIYIVLLITRCYCRGNFAISVACKTVSYNCAR